MRRAESVVRELERRREIWQPAPGLLGLRGDALRLYRTLEAGIARAAREEAEEEWYAPPAIPLATLARADYFASFPQWLTAASHLSGDPSELERIATAPDPAGAAAHSLAPASAALPPAVCYHVYAALSDRTLSGPVRVTASGTCWRHEGERMAPLERAWAFTMREAVCLAAPAEAEAFRRRGLERAIALAGRLGLEARIAEATDPFFAPTARGRELLQRLKALKHELLLPIGAGREVAAASFNHHEAFFGRAFGILLPGGAPAASACIAFGLERWLLAFLVAHGPHARGWPPVDPPTAGAPAGRAGGVPWKS